LRQSPALDGRSLPALITLIDAGNDGGHRRPRVSASFPYAQRHAHMTNGTSQTCTQPKEQIGAHGAWEPTSTTDTHAHASNSSQGKARQAQAHVLCICTHARNTQHMRAARCVCMRAGAGAAGACGACEQGRKEMGGGGGGLQARGWGWTEKTYAVRVRGLDGKAAELRRILRPRNLRKSHIT
jgi:hypothetical protein